MSVSESTGRNGSDASPRAPDAAITAEFSRLIPIDAIEREATMHEIAATPEECAALARRFDLEALHSLTAELALCWVDEGELARLEGRFVAEPVQRCVITTDPVATRLAEIFTMFFTTEAGELASVVEISAEEEDPPDSIAGDAVDIGEAVVQQFGVALNPYPRASKAAAEGLGEADSGNADIARPFAGLSGRLKGKDH